MGPLGVPRSWQKTYPNGASATVGILTGDPRGATEGPRGYQLNGSISLPG
jgi:hypothetical protein